MDETMDKVMDEVVEEAKWYVVHTYSGYENKVKGDLEMTIKNRGLEDQILKVLVPTEKIVEIKRGKEKITERKLFPGYVLVNMIKNDDIWYIIRNTRGVTGFVGPGSDPVPLTPAEIKALGIETPDMQKEEAPIIVFEGKIGDRVRILSGAFKDEEREIIDINEAKQCIRINVEMFNRDTPVDISFADVELID